jgi:hypothetical protein
MHGIEENSYSVAAGKNKGKRKLGSPRRRFEENKINLKDIGWEDVDRIVWFRVWNRGGLLSTRQ